MSPEQARGLKTLDGRSDLWSLGVIAYRCVTGQLPFEGQSIGDLLVKICTSPPPQPSLAAPGLPPSFDAWFARALAREPADRFASATELGEALAVAAGVSVSRGSSSAGGLTASPPPARSTRGVLAVALATALIGALVGVVAFVTLTSGRRTAAAEHASAPAATGTGTLVVATPGASASASPTPGTGSDIAARGVAGGTAASSTPASSARQPPRSVPSPARPASAPQVPARAAKLPPASADPGY
jgi:serine/threonine-protein kinase